MSIEETYKGMWSSDPSLLKSLLDAGETIICFDKTFDQVGRYRLNDGRYQFEDSEGEWLDDQGNIDSAINPSCYPFLIPPRPLVLEPKPLEWKHLEMNEEAVSVDGQWVFYAWNNGGWAIRYMGETLADYIEIEDGTFDTAKAAIHEWRVNHLKSILP